MTYSIKIGNNAPSTLEDYGISEAELEADYEGRSFLTLTRPCNITDPAIIAPFQKVLLYDQDNVVRFVGWLDKAPKVISGNKCAISYELSGPHRWLERAIYTQLRAGVVVLGGSAGATPEGAQPPQQFRAALLAILQSASATYPNQFTWADFQNNGYFYHEIPVRSRSDVDCLTSLLSLSEFQPNLVMWWTYDNPALPRLNLNADTSTNRTLTKNDYIIADADITPRYDLLADQVIVHYVNANSSVVTTQTSNSSGDAASLQANRKVVYTYDTTVLSNLPSAGLANQLAVWHQRLHIDCRATHLAIDWSETPGLIYTYNGEGLSQFNGYKSVLFSIRRNLFTNTTELNLGVIPGKTLYKVRDLDSGQGSTPTITNSQPIPITQIDPIEISDIVGLQDALDNIVTGDLGGALSPDAVTGLPEALNDLTTAETDIHNLKINVNSLRSAIGPALQHLLKLGTNPIPINTDTPADDLNAIQSSEVIWTPVQRCDGQTTDVLTDGGFA